MSTTSVGKPSSPGVYTFDAEGRLAGEKIYYDRATVLRQCGVFREPTTLSGRILLFLNHPVTLILALLRGFARSEKDHGRLPHS